ncbi:MAG: GNAT family N-acetyltransferase [Oscillospiraceae bacterium]|nr:GNAT family N-acetyltransferase [Oscillospiraceae bacterium]
MLIRWITEADLPAWLALSQEYDQYIIELVDMDTWYDGFEVYMARKIAQREALIAFEQDITLGAIAISRSGNRITFYAMSHIAEPCATQALFDTALAELDTARMITVNTPNSTHQHALNQKRFFEENGFVANGIVIENGCPMIEMRRQP